MYTSQITVWSQLTSTQRNKSTPKLTGPTLAQNFTPPEFNEDTTIDEATSQFNAELVKALDATAPIKSIKFTNRLKHPWFNKFIREQNSVEKIMKEDGDSTKKQHQWQAYTKERNVYNKLLIYHKKQTI